MKSIVPFILLALLCGCDDAFPPADTTQPVSLGINTRIVYTEYLGDDSLAVNSILPDGTDRRFVALGYTASPPSKGRIAFVRNHSWSGSVVVSRLDGLDAITLVSVTDNRDFLLQFAALSPKGDLVAYTMREPGQDRSLASIFVIPATGGTSLKVASDIVREGVPVFSPDGTRLAWYTPDRKVRTVRTNGTDLRVVASDAVVDSVVRPELRFGLSWSPTGDRIAFMHGSGGIAESIAVVRADGSAQASLTLDMPRYVAYPSWSPDGRRIAFVAAAATSGSGGAVAVAVADIWLMDADGANKRKIIAVDTVGAIQGVRAIAPEWSPDGKKILFTRYNVADVYPGAGANRGIGSLEVFDLATGETTELVPRAAMAGFWVR